MVITGRVVVIAGVLVPVVTGSSVATGGVDLSVCGGVLVLETGFLVLGIARSVSRSAIRQVGVGGMTTCDVVVSEVCETAD